MTKTNKKTLVSVSDDLENDQCDFIDEEPIKQTKQKKTIIKQIEDNDQCDFIDEEPIKQTKQKKTIIKQIEDNDQCDFIDNIKEAVIIPVKKPKEKKQKYFKCLELAKGSKVLKKGTTHESSIKYYNEIDITKNNVGLLAGINNLIILDVDVKDDGMKEFKQYLKDFNNNEDINTLTQETPTGGLHLIFTIKNIKDNINKYNEELINEKTKYYKRSEEKEKIIKVLEEKINILVETEKLVNRLTNRAKYRNKGLDIRKDKGHIVLSPSSVFNVSTKKWGQYKIINKSKPILPPASLLKWLLEFERDEQKQMNSYHCLLENENTYKDIVAMFDPDNSNEWLKVATATKNLIKYNEALDFDKIYNFFDLWSQQSKKYDNVNNKKIFDNIDLTKSNISLNSLIYPKQKVLNSKLKEGEKKKNLLLNIYKPLPTLTINDDTATKTFNLHHIYDKDHEGEQFKYQYVEDYETIIIKSTTGTGKTSNIAHHLAQYIEDKPDLKILSLIDRVFLSYQHLDSFNKNNINMISYQDEKRDIINDHMVICLNSLRMYSRFTKNDFNNYIVYIDEISSFIETLTHASTLNGCLKEIYIILNRIINNCHKLIVSDATINQNVFNFLKMRPNKLFLINEFVKYKDIKANITKDESEFLQILKDTKKANEKFLFGTDSKTKAEQYFKILEIKEEEGFIISSEEKKIIKNASDEFEGFIVVYTPSITTAVDFSIEKKQKVFLYIGGKTITPSASFQQLTRTRNIDECFIFIDEIEQATPKYINIEDTKEYYKNFVMTHNNDIDNKYKSYVLNELCLSIDSNDEYKFNENLFFDLFTYNEYMFDCFNTNKEDHFLRILKTNNFIINYKNKQQESKKETTKNKKSLKKIMNEAKEQIENEKFEKLIEHTEGKVKNEVYEKRLNFLHLLDKENATKYAHLITNPHFMESYLNFIRLIKDKDYINKKLTSKELNLTKYKLLKSSYYKINLISELEEALKINRFDISKKEEDEPLTINEHLMNKLNSVFESKDNPKTYNQFKVYYMNRLKNLIKNLDIIESKSKWNKKTKKDEKIFKLKEDNIKLYLDLYFLAQADKKELNENIDFIKSYKIDLSEKKLNYINWYDFVKYDDAREDNTKPIDFNDLDFIADGPYKTI